MKRIIIILVFTLPLLSTTCHRAFTYKNHYSDNLKLILLGKKNGCYDSIGYSENTKLNSVKHFSTINMKNRDYTHVVVFNILDSSYWKIKPFMLDEKGIIHLKKEYVEGVKSESFVYCLEHM